MSYAANEQSPSDSQPVELYEISAGGSLYRLTSDHQALTSDGEVYQPVSLDRSAIQVNDAERNDLTISVDATLPFIQSFVGARPSDPARVRIIRAQYADLDDRVILFDGPVTGIKFVQNGSVAEVRVASPRKLTNRPCPSRNFGGRCSLSLYGALCGVDPTGFRITAEVAEVQGRQLVVPAATAFEDGYFSGGSISFVSRTGREARSISSHLADVIELSIAPPSGLIYEGLEVELQAGCDRSYGTCTSRFANSNRFGGFPNIPTTNPTSDGVNP